jgi:hypothetical protein
MSLATSSLMRPSLTRRVMKNPSKSLAASNPNSKKRNFKERKRGMELRRLRRLPSCVPRLRVGL